MLNFSLKQSIFFQWFLWQFFDVPSAILKAWKNFLLFNLNFFSVPLLLKSFFSPWRRYQWAYPRGLDIGKYFEVLISNLISRILGAIMRTFLIIIGIFIEVLYIFAGIIVFFGWLVLPALLIAGLIFGFKILI
jgi:hypothetical protein